MKNVITEKRQNDLSERELCAYGKCRKPLRLAYVRLGLRFCDPWCQEAEWDRQAAKEARR